MVIHPLIVRVVSIIPKTPANSAITFVVYKIFMTSCVGQVRYEFGVISILVVQNDQFWWAIHDHF